MHKPSRRGKLKSTNARLVVKPESVLWLVCWAGNLYRSTPKMEWKNLRLLP